MKRFVLILLSALTLGLWTSATAGDNLRVMKNNFKAIPDSQKLAVYWYWADGYMSKEGVVKDLQAMKKVGINRVQIGVINSTDAGGVRLFSDQWWDILHTAMKTAGDLGIEVGMFNCPGWSQSGGPWVKPNQSMRYLASVKDTVMGPKALKLKLPEVGKDAQDVKVLAYPLQTEGATLKTQGNLLKDSIFDLKSGKELTIRSLTVTPVKSSCKTNAELFVKLNGAYKSVIKFTIDRSNENRTTGFDPYAPIVLSLPEVKGNDFRIQLASPGIAEQIELSEEPKVERYPEKTLAKMFPGSHPMWDAYMWPQQPSFNGVKTISPNDVKDITSAMAADGTLTWNVPKGKWVIQRSAMLPTQVTNSPAPKEGEGLETDKMSKAHIRAHFDNYLGQILKKIPAEDRKTFKIVVEDSYETGGQDWTDNMIEDFKQAYGYDPVPYIPVLSGVVIGNEDRSDRFLWDVRRLVADEVAYNYVGGLREVSHEHGMTTWLETYGHWGFPGEFLQYGSQSDEIAGEFWTNGDLGIVENRLAASCGHIYGKSKIWAESFTSGGPEFTDYPALLKARGDRFFTEGINSTLLHLYIQQPDERQPGVNEWFGTEFNRHNTWFPQLDLFLKYMKRCNYMLQQGQYVADVAYFIGEDAPKMMGQTIPDIPKGFSYDFVNAEVLMDAQMEDGKLSLKSGMQYRILVLPETRTMRPELLRKLKELVAQGLVLMGEPPIQSPSLKDYPKADEEVQALAEELWQTKLHPYDELVKYGEGRIYRRTSLEHFFKSIALAPDFSTDDPMLPVLFIHRKLAEGDLYFISNQKDSTLKFNCLFRIKGKRPELWNPQTTEVYTLPNYRLSTSGTEIPLELQPSESAFILFRNDTTEKAVKRYNYPQQRLLAKVETPWTVAFQKGGGGPESPVTFQTLSDWSKSEDTHIKYFSGTADYATTFKLTKLPKKRIFIDLGKVMVMAKVKVNGQYVGGVWTSPYSLDITDAVRKGLNTLEVEVVNCWRNRIIGDRKVSEKEHVCFRTSRALPMDSDVMPAGLLGPVTILYLEE